MEKLKEIELLLNDTFNWSRTILSELQAEAELPALNFFMISYFERIIYSLDSVKYLIPIYKTNPHYETSIGLILRTSLLDFLTITYLSSIEIRKSSTLNEEIYKIITDQINRSIQFLKTVRSKNLITEGDFDLANRNLFETYNFLFEKFEKENLDKELKYKPKSLSQMFAHIYETKEIRHYANAYDTYNYYSKYEHFGIQTYSIQRRGVNEDIFMMALAIDYCLKGIALSLVYLENKISEYKSKHEELLELIGRSEVISTTR